MNEKNNIRIFIIGLICGLVAGGIAVGAIVHSRSAGEISELSIRNDTLNREYLERQSIIDEQQRELGERIDECIGYAENARTIIERTGENASRAVSNLTAAISFIRQGIEERKNLEMELDNIRTGLLRIRTIGGMGGE